MKKVAFSLIAFSGLALLSVFVYSKYFEATPQTSSTKVEPYRELSTATAVSTSTLANLNRYFSVVPLRAESKTLKSIGLTPENYPIIDGATASQPIRQLIICQAFQLECHWYETESREMFLSPNIWTSNNLSNLKKDILQTQSSRNAKTHDAYLDLINGKNDLILVSTEPSVDELKAAEKAGVKLELTPIGLDGFIFLVHKDNPIRNLDTADIRAIYSGKMTKWPDGGKTYADINPFTRQQNSGSQELMEKLVMKGTAMDPTLAVERAIMSMVTLIEGVENDKNAIGYSLYFYKNNMIDKRDKRPGVKLISIDGVEPSPQTISIRSYPYTFNIYAVTRDTQPKNSRAYQIKEWLTGKEGQEVIRTAGYSPLRL